MIGKSTLINALRHRRLASMPEAGRAIIRDQVQIGGAALPWADRAMFAELMLGWELRSWHEASAVQRPVLTDRGVPDVVSCLTLCGLPVPAHMEAATKTYRYNRKVFIAPYWEDIFGKYAERKQDKEDAEVTEGSSRCRPRQSASVGRAAGPEDIDRTIAGIVTESRSNNTGKTIHAFTKIDGFGYKDYAKIASRRDNPDALTARRISVRCAPE